MFRLLTHRGIRPLLILIGTGWYLLPVCFCTDDYNPFTDTSNTKMYLSGSFGNGDTIDLFSTETLTVMVAVPELADSLVVSAHVNRLFDNGVRAYGAADPGALHRGPYRCLFSMYDTGWQDVRCTLKRSNGETMVKSLTCYVRSPLVPNVVRGSYGAEVRLVTIGVANRDVFYTWDFGREMVITTARPETTVVLHTSGLGTSGKLSISDGYVTSPPVAFEYVLFDTIGPIVDFMDELYQVSGDTVSTSDTIFFFRVVIKDRNAGGVDSASINGASFDLVDDSMYTKIFNRMDTLQTPRRMTLYAIDNFQYYNDTTASFYLRFNPDARTRSGLRLLMWVPPRDTTLFTTRTKKLLGTVEHVAGDSIHTTVQITVNGSEAYATTLNGQGSVDWSASVKFDDSVNVVGVTAYNSRGDSVAALQRVVRVQAGIEDTVPPVIVGILDGGEHAHGRIVDFTPVQLRVLAFDAAEGVKAVRFNALEITSTNGVGWEYPVDLIHQKGGNVIRIEVIDRNGLSTDSSVVMYLNNRPVPVHIPTPPVPLFAGESLVDSFIVSDMDGDSLVYRIDAEDTTATIDRRGYLYWKTERGDTGSHLFRLRVYDGYDEITHIMKVEVVEKERLEPPVRFSVTADEFPRWVEATVDTVREVMRTVPGTGRKPFTYTTIRMSDGRPLPIRNDTLEIVPSMRDTGRLQMRSWVTDRYQRSDTIYPVVMVVPPNRQCRLRQVAGFDTISGGIYNESDWSSIDTLVFIIEDPDIDLVEKFTVAAWKRGAAQGLVVGGNRTVRYILRGTDTPGGYDTIKVVLTDRVLHRDTVELVVYYGMPPDTPVLLQPAHDTSFIDSTVRFFWNGGDPDGDVLFKLLSGPCPGPLEAVTELRPENNLIIDTIRTSGRYCWQVIASDGKSEVSSTVNSFYFRVPDHVTFTTSEADFPPALEALGDSLLLPLVVDASTGTPPFAYRAFFTESGTTLTPESAMLRYFPTAEDTGMQHLVVTVTDENDNSDTLYPQLFVTPPNRPCSLSLEYNGTWFEEGIVDMSNRSEPDTLFFNVIDPDTSLTEQHTVTVRQLNVVEVGSLDVGRMIAVILDPRKTGAERDTVTVQVEDRAGHTASGTVNIYYGVN